MTAPLHDSLKILIFFLKAAGLEPSLTSLLLLSVIHTCHWLNNEQAITSMASPLFTWLLTGCLVTSRGCLISLGLHRVSLRVATLCTAGACLASNIKPGSLWNLSKVSSGRGWKLSLIGISKGFCLDTLGQVRETRSRLPSSIHAAVGSTHSKQY